MITWTFVWSLGTTVCSWNCDRLHHETKTATDVEELSCHATLLGSVLTSTWIIVWPLGAALTWIIIWTTWIIVGTEHRQQPARPSNYLFGRWPSINQSVCLLPDVIVTLEHIVSTEEN